MAGYGYSREAVRVKVKVCNNKINDLSRQTDFFFLFLYRSVNYVRHPNGVNLV